MVFAWPTHALESASETSFLEALPVVLSISRIPAVRADLPAAVTILDQRLIRATGYRDIGRLLRLVPGMQTGQERGNSFWMTYHGLGKDYPNQLRFQIDGHSAFMDASTHPMIVPLAIEDIERIEIVRGSDYALQGSNGFLGLVNIVTRHSRDEPRSEVRLTAGARGVADLIVRGAAKRDDASLRVTAQRIGDDGFSRLSDSRQIHTANLRADLRLDARNSLTIVADAASSRRGLGFADTRFNGAGLRDERSRAHRLGLNWLQQLGPDTEIEISVHHGKRSVVDEWTASTEAMPQIGLPAITLPVNANFASQWSAIEIQHRFMPTRATRMTWGLEYRRESVRSASLFHGNPKRQRNTARAFLNAEWRFAPDWLFNASAMAEQLTKLPTRVAPRAFLVWQPRPDRSWRLGYTRAYHQPSLFEQHADSRIVHPTLGLLQQRHIANPGIRAQRIDVVEAGLFLNRPAVGTIDVRLFQESIGDLIERIPSALPAQNDLQAAIQDVVGSSGWDNQPRRIHLRGIETEWHSPRISGTQFVLTHSLTSPTGGSRILRRRVASHTASLTWLQDWNGWHSSMTVFRRGKMDASTGFVPDYQYILPALTQLDASVWRTFKLGGHRGELRLTGLNLLRSRQEVAFNPVQQASGSHKPNLASRSLYASLSMQF